MTTRTPFDLPAGKLEGKVAVITGASRGLGAGMAARFAEHGMQLGLCARHEPTPPPGARALTAAVDVTNADVLDRFATAVATNLGPVDIWINNAGVVTPIGPLRATDAAAVDEALRINIAGVINGSRSFADRARGWREKHRVLINISSGAARSAYAGWSVYGATKAAVEHLTEILAVEEPELICHAVAPGVIDTDMQALLRRQKLKDFPDLERFNTIHQQGAWNSPAWVADHLLAVLCGEIEAPVVFRVPDEPRV